MLGRRIILQLHLESPAGQIQPGFFETDHAGNSVEPLNGDSKGGEHLLCDILNGAGVNTPAAKWRRLFDDFGEFTFARWSVVR